MINKTNFRVIAAFVLGLSQFYQADAATLYKQDNTTGLSSTASWATTSGGATAPSSIGTTDTGVFGSTLSAANALNLSLGGNLSIGTLQFDNNLNGPVSIASGSTLTLNDATGFDLSAANQDVTNNCAVALGASQTWNAASGRTLVLDGVISGSSTLDYTGGGTFLIGGINSDSGNLTIDGATVHVNTGATLFCDGLGWAGRSVTLQNGGTLESFTYANGSGNLWGQCGDGAANIIFATGGGTFKMLGTNMNSSVNKGLTVNSGITGHFYVPAGTSCTWLGSYSGRDFTVGGTLDFNGGGDFTTSRYISGSGSVTKSDGGTLTLQSVNSFSGSLTVNGGTLVASASTTGGYASATGSGGSGNTITVNSGATLKYTGSRGTGYHGANCFINGGTVTFDNSDMSWASGKTVKFDSAAGTMNGTGQWRMRDASPVVQVTTAASGSTISVNELTFTTTSGNHATFDVADGAQAADLTISSTIDEYSSGEPLTKISAGTLVLTGTNTYTGTTTISGGTLTIGGAGQLGGGAYSSGITDDATFNYASSASQTLSGVISGTGSLAVSGAGTLTLNNAMTYGGNTTISAGTLALGASGSLASTPAITIGSGATFDVSANGFTFTGSSPVQTLACGSTNGTANINATGTTLTLDAGAQLSFQADAGSGTVGAISVTGNLTLNANDITVNLQNGSTLPVGTYTLMTCSGTLTANGAFPPPSVNVGANAASVSVSGSSLVLTVSVPVATITTGASTFPGSLATTYGTASTATSTAVSGANLTTDITATAPTGFEVSSDGTTYGATANFAQNSGSASGTLYVRIKNNAPVSGTYNSQNVVLTSTGATTVNVATTASGNSVSAKALTVATAAATDKLYDGTTAATVSGSLQTAEAFGSGSSSDGAPYTGDTLTLTCTGSTFASAGPGTGIAVTAGTFALSGSSAGNYTLTQPSLSLTANIYASAVWTSATTPGSWTNSANWQNNLVGSGTGVTADLSTLTMSADQTVTLDGAQTIGNLIFGDAGAAHNWSLNTGSGGPLTLSVSSGAPDIDVSNQTATIGAVLAGTNGLTKTGSGTLVLSGANSYTGTATVNAGSVVVPAGGSLNGGGNVVVNGGSLSITNNGPTLNFIGNSTDGSFAMTNGAVTLNNTAQYWDMTIGNHAVGTWNQTGGAATLNVGEVSVANWSSAAGSTLNLSGGTFTVAGAAGASKTNFYLGTRGDATLNIGGTAAVTIPVVMICRNPDGNNTMTSTLNLNGGSLTTRQFVNGNASATSVVNFNGGSLVASSDSTSFMTGLTSAYVSTNGAFINDGGFAVTIGQDLLHDSTLGATADGGLTKTGTGTLTITGNNTYTGDTIISAGTLALNSGGAIASPGIAVAAGAAFDVSGVSGGSYALSVSGALTLDVNKSGAALTEGQVVIGANNLTYAGGLTVSASGDALASGDSFPLISKTSGTLGSWFSSVTLPSLPAGTNGLDWDTNDLATAGVLNVYSFGTTPLVIATPTNTPATVAATKLAAVNAVSAKATAYATAYTSPAHGSVVINGDHSITYTPATDFAGTDTFDLTFQDGYGLPQTVAVTVTVGAGIGQSPNLLVSGVVGGNFVLQFAGYPGYTYTVETNGVLDGSLPWGKLGNYTTPANGIIHVTNSVIGASSLFYRTVYPSH